MTSHSINKPLEREIKEVFTFSVIVQRVRYEHLTWEIALKTFDNLIKKKTNDVSVVSSFIEFLFDIIENYAIHEGVTTSIRNNYSENRL